MDESGLRQIVMAFNEGALCPAVDVYLNDDDLSVALGKLFQYFSSYET